MSKITQTLVAREGKYLIMPPHKEGQLGWGNLAIPGVHVAGGDATMLYPVGTKFVDFDRTFIYGYTSGKFITANKANIGLFNTNTEATVTWGAAAGVAADTLCPILTSTMDAYTTAAVNLFAGGYLMTRTNPYGCYRIVSSTVYNGGVVATETDLTIEEPGLGAAVTASQASCKLGKNPFTSMYSHWGGACDYQSCVGVTLIDPTASTYQWVQTWGPIIMLGGEQGGGAANLRSAWFAMDGTIIAGAQIIPSATSQHQYAGYILPDTYTQGSTYAYGGMINLQMER